jgi:DNA-binding NarL/FixJ family response regulator
MDLLAAVRTLAADLVILDVGTHGMGGSLLVSAVRELASDLPIVVVSTTDGAEIRAMTLQGVPHVVLGAEHDGHFQRLVTGLAERRRPALGTISR